MKSYFNKSLAIPFDEAVARVTEEWKKVNSAMPESDRR